MIERCQQLRLSLETRSTIRVGGQRIRQQLQRHIATQLRIACAIALSHAAFAEQSRDLVRADLLANADCHESDGIIRNFLASDMVYPSCPEEGLRGWLIERK